jgi:hypothetical protein
MNGSQPLTVQEWMSRLIGDWVGSNRLHDPGTQAPDDSPGTMTVTPMLRGTFYRLDYTWLWDGDMQEGSILVGTDPDKYAVTGVWIDTWHMSLKMMSCEGGFSDEGGISLRGSYAAPPGPDWSWRIELHRIDGDRLQLQMFNVWPEGGKEEIAVEATYRRR